MPERLSIAIDGPASSGKGTVARRVAKELGYAYVDTGALYRGVGLRVLERGGDPRDAALAEEIARNLRFGFSWVGGQLSVAIEGRDVTEAIRGEAVSAAASAVAVHPGVRAALLQTQRDLGGGGGVVMDGRDVGTVVLPHAQLKIFLDASPEERARRRHLDQPDHTYADVLEALRSRDAQDSGRTTAPLRRAGDAVVIDTTGSTIDTVVGQILVLARARGA